jgi:predicted anti-sigma-YlaC factor YlaD
MKKDKPGRDSACSFIRSHLVAIAEKDVAGEAFPGVQDHLGSCPECASLVQQFSRAWEDPAPQEDTKSSPSFFPLLIERIEAEERSRSGRQGALAVAWRVLKPAAVAAIFLGGIFAGHELGKRDRAILPPETAFSGQALKSFVNIPPGSVADFYVSRQNSEKEGLE